MSVAKRVADEMDGEHILFFFITALSRHLAMRTVFVSRPYGVCPAIECGHSACRSVSMKVADNHLVQ